MDLVNRQWENPLANGLTNQTTRYWIDDVFMVVSLQSEAFKATEDIHYLDRAANLTQNYIDSLQQESGLFFHGPDAPIYWGRGNGWMAVGIAKMLELLPQDHIYYDDISNGYLKMMNALILYQGENGLWRQVIDLDTAWEETSCSAMFAYALQVGINKGILKGEKYQESVYLAWNTLLENINENGALDKVCAGTGQSKDVKYYLDRPVVQGDFHGQAPLLWLIKARLEAETKKPD